MLIGILALLMQAQTPPVATSGRPVNQVPVEAPVQQGGDATVLGTIGAFDANVIEATKLAATKASNGDVKSFADLLMRERQACLTKGADLAKTLKITRLLPPDSLTARLHERKMTELSVLTGSAFDKAFVKFMVDDNQAMIAKIQGGLVPKGSRPQVQTYVNELLPKLVTHVETGQKWLAAHP